jgi:hypothetical protein
MFAKSPSSRSSVAGIATRQQVGRFDVRIPVRSSDFFLLQKRLTWLWGPLSLLFDSYPGSFPGVKRERREVELHTFI